ncbi:hypothetical protein Tco_0267594 [Tanacetum coccineum]
MPTSEGSSPCERSQVRVSPWWFPPVKNDDNSFGCLPANSVCDLQIARDCLARAIYRRRLVLDFITISNLVDTVSFTASTDPKFNECAYKSLKEFRRLKSLMIELPRPLKVVNPRSYKWKINIDKKFNTFVFLSANSVCDLQIARDCLARAIYRRRLVLDFFFKLFPFVGRMFQFWILGDKASPLRAVSYCYVPFLKLPACGYVMEGVCLLLRELGDDNDDTLTRFNLDDFEDREEAAYSEAVMKVLTEHRGLIIRRMGPPVVE